MDNKDESYDYLKFTKDSKVQKIFCEGKKKIF